MDVGEDSTTLPELLAPVPAPHEDFEDTTSTATFCASSPFIETNETPPPSAVCRPSQVPYNLVYTMYL